MHRTVAQLVFCSLVAALLLPALAAPAHAHGLLTAGRVDGGTPPPETRGQSALRLSTHRVKATVTGPVAHVAMEQTFLNTTDQQLEGTYLFPLPEGAVVSKFAMTLGGKLIEGEVMDAGQARAVYEQIVRRRRDPGLLEYVGRGLFRASVFPIEPRSKVDIRLAFEQVLPDHNGTLEFRYPLATSRIHGEPVDEVVVTVDVASEVPVRSLYSPSHRVAVAHKDERKAHASYEGSGLDQDRDFLLYIGRSPEEVGFSILGHRAADGDGTFLAVLAPSVQPSDERLPKDVIFVLDTSGSMGGDDKLGQARRAVQFGLSVLREGDRFGIVTFSSQTRRFSDALIAVTPKAQEEARLWLDGLVAEGGTHLQGGLQDALSLVQKDRLAIVVLVSDGRPTAGARDANTILAEVGSTNPHQARVFTFGVGFDLDVELLDRIAEATRGARDYVLPREELEIATSRFFRKIVDPILTDLRLDMGDDVHEVYPHPLPDLFAGGQLVVLGRYAKAGARRIVLRGRRGDQETEFIYEAVLPADDGHAFLPRLWAQRKVAYLLDEIRLHGQDEELVESVRTLGLRHGIVTPYTSRLVTDGSETPPHLATSANPLLPRTPPAVSRGGSGGGGYYRGPGGAVPPGLREPSDPTPPPPPPPSGPPSTPAPITPTTPGGAYGPSAPGAVATSKSLRRAKERGEEEEVEGVRRAGGRVFIREDDVWVDTAWPEEAKPTKLVAFSDAWLALTKRHTKLAQILALGDRIRFVWEDQAYEVVRE